MSSTALPFFSLSLFPHSVATWRFAFRSTFYLSGTGWGTKQIYIYLRASEEMPLSQKGRRGNR